MRSKSIGIVVRDSLFEWNHVGELWVGEAGMVKMGKATWSWVMGCKRPTIYLLAPGSVNRRWVGCV